MKHRTQLVVVFLLVFAFLTGCTNPTVSEGPTPLPAIKADTRVIVDGHVIPIHSADLSFSVSGTVDEVLVAEGDTVALDQPLARLQSGRQRASVAQAEADVQRAQARLSQVRAGSRSQEIEGARAAVDAAQAQVEALKAGASPAEIAAAQANVAQAEAGLQKAQTPANEADVAAAKAEMDNAAAKLRLAQAEYDQVGELPGVGASPQSIALEQRTNEYNAAKARYESASRGPNAADIASARAQLDRARAELQAKQAPPRAADLAAAEAEVRRAQSQLDLLLAGPQAEELLVAEADLAAAQAQREQAMATLAETELRAPFAGTIAAVDIVPGQQVGPAASVVQLADLSSWLVETRDLTELRVVGIRPGDRAIITFDAIPDLELPGQVLRVRSIGQNTQGDITYTAVIAPDRHDERLLWNMTAKMILEPGSGSGQVTGAAATRMVERPPTRTPTATPTAVATASPTTPEPPAPTIAPKTSVTPTVQASLPAGTPAAPRLAATAAGQAGPTAAPVKAVAPVLLQPVDGETARGAVVFRWEPAGPLPQGGLYEVVAWPADAQPAVAQGLAPATTRTRASVNLDLMASADELTGGRLFWTVIVVRQDPYQRLTEPTGAGARLLVWAGPAPTAPPKPKG
jgi:multidrug resistance efflux pump